MHIFHKWQYTKDIYDGEDSQSDWRGCSLCGRVEKYTWLRTEAFWDKRYKFEWVRATRLNAEWVKTHVWDEARGEWEPKTTGRGRAILQETCPQRRKLT